LTEPQWIAFKFITRWDFLYKIRFYLSFNMNTAWNKKTYCFIRLTQLIFQFTKPSYKQNFRL